MCWNIDDIQIVSWTIIGFSFAISLYEIHNFFLFFTSSYDFVTKPISEHDQLRNKYTHLQFINGETFYFIFFNEPNWLISWINKQLSLSFSFFTSWKFIHVVKSIRVNWYIQEIFQKKKISFQAHHLKFPLNLLLFLQ